MKFHYVLYHNNFPKKNIHKNAVMVIHKNFLMFIHKNFQNMFIHKNFLMFIPNNFQNMFIHNNFQKCLFIRISKDVYS